MKNPVLNSRNIARALLPLLAFLFFTHVAAAQERTPGTLPPASERPAVSSLQAQQQQADELAPFYSESGLISLSIDGLGTNDSEGGTVQVDKPAGATVRQAFLLAATTPNGGPLADGDVTLEGTSISWDERVPSPLGFASSGESGYADVTSLVQPIVDGAPAGTVDLQITEPNGPSDMDGEILAVVFDDPNQTEPQTVVLAFGAQDPDGDNFAITLAEPFDEASQSILLSLGISFGFQTPSAQFSIIDVNGDRLTSAAGGQDDCDVLDTTGNCPNGTLLTVGGIGDSEDNPSDPNAGPEGDPRADDELYTLDPFIDDGDTQIDAFTQNPSNDDNIFFAAFVIQGGTAIVGEDILLAPARDTNAVGTDHTLTATVQDDAGDPIEGASVDFEVTSGPNAGVTGSETTNADGEALFTYSSSEAGTDVITASFVNSEDETITSNEATKVWEAEEEGVATVTFNDQTSEDSLTVTVASVFLPEDGYIAIHNRFLLEDPPVVLGSVIGVSQYLEAGTHEDVEVTLFDVPGLDVPADTTLEMDQTLIAMPHQETSGNEAYNFLTSGGAEDGAYTNEEGDAVVDPAFITLEEEEEEDQTPPVCGTIEIERDDQDRLAAVETSVTDAESGIASVAFTRLRNLEGFAGGDEPLDGPFTEGHTESFPDAPPSVAIRGERLDFNKGGAILTTVTNGAGLSSRCDPAAEQLASVPEAFALEGNYPNPFSGATTVRFRVAEKAAVTIEVYDVLGRRVATLVDGEELGPGSYQVSWEAEGAASGTYVYRMEAGGFTASRSMTIVK